MKHQRKPLATSLAVLLMTMYAGSNIAFAGNSVDTTALAPYGQIPAPEDMVSTFSFPPSGFNIDTANRDMVRDFYLAVFKQTSLVEANWNGSDPCTAGDSSNDFKLATLARINYFRAMAGVDANTTLDNTLDTDAQNLAMEVANPGADCSSNSTVAITEDTSLAFITSKGVSGANAVTSLMDDFGVGNEDMLTRMFVLEPSTTEVGTGNIDNSVGASILWAATPTTFSANSLRDGFVSWPSPNYVPANLIFDRWSFLHPTIDLSVASITVTMKDAANGDANIPLQIKHRENGLISWVPELPKNPDDLIGNESTDWVVTIQDSGQDLIPPYHVKAFNPSAFVPVTGELAPGVNQNFTYAFADNNSNLDSNSIQYTLTSGPIFLDAENPPSYVVSSQQSLLIATDIFAGGTQSFHLSNPDGQTESFSIEKDLVVGDNATLEFDSRIAYASSDQTANIVVRDVTTQTWNILQPELLTGASTNTTIESSFSHKSVDLSAYQGKTIHIRFNYKFDQGIFSFATSNSGWYIDNIGFNNVTTATNEIIPPIDAGDPASGFNYTPDMPGDYVVTVSGNAFGGYPLDWNLNLRAEFRHHRLDINGDDSPSDALTDGLAIIRYLFSPSGFSAQDICPADVSDTVCIATIKSQVQGLNDQLDVDGNGTKDALTDGLLMIRYFFGLRGDALISNAVANDCTRCDSTTIANHINSIQ